MDTPTTTTDPDLPELDDTAPPSEIVSVPVRLTGGRFVAHCAQTTVHPQLVVVPEVNEGRFTGGFTLAHTPTGLVLDCSCWYLGELTPATAAAVAARLTRPTHLDWTSTDRADYQGEHKQAWLDALRAVADLRAGSVL